MLITPQFGPRLFIKSNNSTIGSANNYGAMGNNRYGKHFAGYLGIPEHFTVFTIQGNDFSIPGTQNDSSSSQTRPGRKMNGFIATGNRFGIFLA